jgi:Phosphotransferase enzyme family
LIADSAGTSLDTPRSSLLALVAYAFMPAEPGRRGVVVEASGDWRFDPSRVESGADVVVWGRPPEGSLPLAWAARGAARREVALRTLSRRLPARLHVIAVHRLPPRRLALGRVRGGVRSALRGGALVELRSAHPVTRVLDAVAEAAGVSHSGGAVHAGAGGALLVQGRLGDGSAAVLRVARTGSAGDPATLADTLKFLGRQRVPLAPRLRAHGQTAGASWLVEEALPGRRPSRATASLTGEVADVCSSLPRGDGPPTATAADLSAIALALPERAEAVRRIASDLSDPVQELPSVLRHGDLWAGNLLVDRAGKLSGLVDWDAAHRTSVPGADLLQLVATEFRRKTRRALGPAFLARPWRLSEYADATARYWPAVGIRPDEDLLDVIGLAWWATEVHGTLARLPHRAGDERWVETNVDRVLTGLGS